MRSCTTTHQAVSHMSSMGRIRIHCCGAEHWRNGGKKDAYRTQLESASAQSSQTRAGFFWSNLGIGADLDEHLLHKTRPQWRLQPRGRSVSASKPVQTSRPVVFACGYRELLATALAERQFNPLRLHTNSICINRVTHKTLERRFPVKQQ